MEKIGSYYQGNVYSRSTQAAADKVQAGAAENTEAAKAAGENGKAPVLSKEAQKLLKELQKSYGNMDFIVADYKTDGEASALLSRGAKEYSALFTPEELEKMAADEDVKKENLKVLDGAVSKLEEMKGQLGDKADDIARVGIAIDDKGQATFFAELEKNSEKQRERIEKQREEKKEVKKSGKQETEYQTGGKRTTVYASTVEELAQKISAVDWNAVKEERQNAAGKRFDFTV